jgi:HEPN domain-containing protein
MKTMTKEWIQKAEGDFATAQRELQAEDNPNYDAVCFHAQQCAEKYLKARLVEADLPFPKIHDLGIILDLLLPIEPTWESLRGELNSLNDRAVEVRYPGYLSDADEAKDALEIASKVRQTIRQAFGL